MTHQLINHDDARKEGSSCVFCQREFARSDALRRHWTTCKTRIDGGLDVPAIQGKTRGRKLRSCDRCSRLKQACNSTKPCVSCNRGNHVCTYYRHKRRVEIKGHGCLDGVEIDSKETTNLSSNTTVLPSDILHLVKDSFSGHSQVVTTASSVSLDPTNLIMDYDDWNLFAEYSLAATVLYRPTAINMHILIRFPFLENFTKSGGFVRSFECGSREDRSSIIALAGSARSANTLFTSHYDNDLMPSWIDLTTAALAPIHEIGANNDEYSVLLPKTHDIVAAIRDVVTAKPSRSTMPMVWSPSLEARCYEFFHPSSILKFLALFWNCWSPNCPIIHQPSFDPVRRSTKLAAAMIILGSCFSCDAEDLCLARTWFDIVEQLVFGDEFFLEDDPSGAWGAHGSQLIREAHIDILQAAYCVCLYQTWEGSKQSRRRILRQRFSALLHLARDINFEHASLRTVNLTDLASFNWDEYILRESLTRICTYICNIDSAFALFYHYPPRIVLSEMTLEMTSPETCFRATSADECLTALQVWRRDSGAIAAKFTLATSIEALYDPATSMNLALQQAFANMSVLNMFTIISALYAQVFILETSPALVSRAAEPLPIETALRQWKEFWPSSNRDAELAELAHQDKLLHQGFKRVGFIRHAPEYWLLTHLILEWILKSNTSTRRLEVGNTDEQLTMQLRLKCANNEMTETHALVTRFQCLDPATIT